MLLGKLESSFPILLADEGFLNVASSRESAHLSRRFTVLTLTSRLWWVATDFFYIDGSQRRVTPRHPLDDRIISRGRNTWSAWLRSIFCCSGMFHSSDYGSNCRNPASEKQSYRSIRDFFLDESKNCLSYFSRDILSSRHNEEFVKDHSISKRY